jgi:hypothetical protein
MGAIETLYQQLRSSPRPYITDAELAVLLGGTPDSRYGKVKRLLAQGTLLHIRRGLYCYTDRVWHYSPVHPYELAQHIYGPSYISLESALSFHQLIPEKTFTVTSVAVKRSRQFMTPLGPFSFLHLPTRDFYVGVERIEENGHIFFMANPWKAICDYVYCYKKDWKSLDPLHDSLRIDIDQLPVLQQEDIRLLEEYYHHSRISRFLGGVK